MFTVVSNVVLLCLKALAIALLFEILDIFYCLLLSPHKNFIRLIDVHLPQTPFARILIYLRNI
jgi:hypothetical protein